MKNGKIALLALIIAAAFTACHTGTHVIVASDDNNTKIKLEYWGTVELNSDRSALLQVFRTMVLSITKRMTMNSA